MRVLVTVALLLWSSVTEAALPQQRQSAHTLVPDMVLVYGSYCRFKSVLKTYLAANEERRTCGKSQVLVPVVLLQVTTDTDVNGKRYKLIEINHHGKSRWFGIPSN